MKSNFRNSVNYFTRFLGLQGRPSFYPEERKWLTVNTELNENGKTLFEVNYEGQKQSLTPEQLTATMLNKLKSIINLNEINFAASNCVISVPSYYTEQERKALLDACRIAEFPLERLINETSAIAVSYGLFRKKDLDKENPRHVVFVDLGHSKMSAFVGSFLQEKAKIVAQVNDRNLGARNIDWNVFEHYCQMFEQESGGLQVQTNKKAKLRLLEAIEKQRKVLSANAEGWVNIEYLMEDIDFNTKLVREELDKFAAPFIADLRSNLELLAQQIANMKLNIHSVEIIGGATRIPIVQ